MTPRVPWHRSAFAQSAAALAVGVILIGLSWIVQARWAVVMGEGLSSLLVWSSVFLLGVGSFAWGLLRPLRRLRPLFDACRRRAAGELEIRLGISGDDEFGALEKSFNHMADEVNRTLETEKRFFSLSNSLLCVAGFDGHFKRLNPAWESTLGYPIEELTSRPWLEFVHPEDRGRTIQEGSKLLGATDQTVEFENRYICRDGSVRWFSWNCVPVPGEELIYAVVTDVTRRKATEAHLLQAQKMEAVGRFTAAIVHDFNNNLGVILSNAELISEAVGVENSLVHELTDDIVSAANHGAELTKKLLGFSREGSLKRENLDPVAFLRGEGPIVRRVVPETIEVQLNAADEGPRIAADPTALRQILLNLVSNSVDAMPQGGRLTIALREVDVDEIYADFHPGALPGRYICLSVTDDGIGMDEATVGRIFDPFFTTKGVGEGTGLGMSTIYGLAKQHGGFVHVYSEPGIGTTVKTYLPVDEAAEARPSPKKGTPEVPAKGTVLVVEDNDALRRSAARHLESFGYSVLTAENGERAFECLTHTAAEVDLVFTDVVMPRMGGVELYKRVRERGIKVPFVFTTGYGGSALGDLGETDPPPVVVRKPWVRQELAAALSDALASGSLVQSAP